MNNIKIAKELVKISRALVKADSNAGFSDDDAKWLKKNGFSINLYSDDAEKIVTNLLSIGIYGSKRIACRITTIDMPGNVIGQGKSCEEAFKNAVDELKKNGKERSLEQFEKLLREENANLIEAQKNIEILKSNISIVEKRYKKVIDFLQSIK